MVSHHLGKKKYHSEVTCQGRTTKAKARIWRLKGAEDLCQTGSAAETLRWHSMRRWCPSCCVQLLYKANGHCLSQFQKLTGRPVKLQALCKRFIGRNILQMPMNSARNISAAALHVYLYLLGNLSWGASSRRKEPIWSSVRTELLMLANETWWATKDGDTIRLVRDRVSMLKSGRRG